LTYAMRRSHSELRRKSSGLVRRWGEGVLVVVVVVVVVVVGDGNQGYVRVRLAMSLDQDFGGGDVGGGACMLGKGRKLERSYHSGWPCVVVGSASMMPTVASLHCLSLPIHTTVRVRNIDTTDSASSPAPLSSFSSSSGRRSTFHVFVSFHAALKSSRVSWYRNRMLRSINQFRCLVLAMRLGGCAHGSRTLCHT